MCDGLCTGDLRGNSTGGCSLLGLLLLLLCHGPDPLPTSISTPRYTTSPGDFQGEGVSTSCWGTGYKRCVHYLANGGCALPDEFMCVEWMKANGQGPASPPSIPSAAPAPSTAVAPQQHDLFGPPQVLPHVAAPVAPRLEEPRRSVEPEPMIDLDQLRGLSTDDIESFKALGVEVCLRSEALGEVWLVPARTGQPRKEITPELAATIVRVTSAFPGSRVVALNSKPEPTNSQEESAP